MDQSKKEELRMEITKDDIKLFDDINNQELDEGRTKEYLFSQDNYNYIDVYLKKSHSNEVLRCMKDNSVANFKNNTLAELTFQIYENDILALSEEEKKDFPVFKSSSDDPKTGIYTSEDAYAEAYKVKYENSRDKLIYKTKNDTKFIIKYYRLFHSSIFSQECLKRFGQIGDKFVINFSNKDKGDSNMNNRKEGQTKYEKNYSSIVQESKNVIIRGAPGTGKSYLAKKIATEIISGGSFDDYTKLNDEQKQQIEFVQFHPSYDYTDFVEGLRPKINKDGSMGFELRDGVFKSFVQKAKENFKNSKKSQYTIENEASNEEMFNNFFLDIEFGEDEFKTIRGTKFYITSMDENNIYISVPKNTVSNEVILKINTLKELLISDQDFKRPRDITSFLGRSKIQEDSYYLVVCKEIKQKETPISKPEIKQEKKKPYIFIIDEINRGEISKILGELFFSIDPGYRGPSGEVSTQYANLHENPQDKFYIPDNVYIIGTMNDIDRSVDSFDFAMRRRFRFIEIKSSEHVAMLDILGEMKTEAVDRMTSLNNEISEVKELNDNYHIGPSYFLKLETIDFAQLWTDYISPLLQDYIRGMYGEEEIMNKFEKAYNLRTTRKGNENDESNEGDEDDITQD